MKIKFDGKILNDYALFNDEDESFYLENMAMDESACPWLTSILAIPGTSPAWLIVWVLIYRNTLSFEAKGWETFACS